MQNITGWSASAQAEIEAPTMSEWLCIERELVAARNAVTKPTLMMALDLDAPLEVRKPRKRLAVPKMALGDRLGALR